MNKVKQILTSYKLQTSLFLRTFIQKFFVKRNLPLGIFVLIILVGVSGLIFGLYKLIAKTDNSKPTQIEVAPAKATIEVNKEFIFPLKNEKGSEVSKIKYTIESAELRNEIIVKGQRARSVKGRIFLILNLKIVNDYKQKIEIQTADYVRLSVNGNKEVWLAPDTHSDPVAIQAISTKYTKIGFSINESDKDLILRIGEINGEKQELPIKF